MQGGQEIARDLLGRLLDKAEAQQSPVAARRPQIRVTDQVVRGYVSGGMDPDIRAELHDALEHWQSGGLLDLKWVRFEAGNLLERIYLTERGAAEGFQVLGRLSKADVVQTVRRNLTEVFDALSVDWMRLWLTDALAALDERASVPGHLLPADSEKLGWLLQSLMGIVDKGDEELAMRVFSKRYLRDSKLFERHVKSWIAKLYRRYGAQGAEAWKASEFASRRPVSFPPTRLRVADTADSTKRASTANPAELVDTTNPDHTQLDTIYGDLLSDDDALAEIGIVISGEDISFCGPLTLMVAGRMVDCSVFPRGLSLDSATLLDALIVNLPVQRILSIENKANYRHYIARERRNDELVVYAGGFHSPHKRKFLAKLRESLFFAPLQSEPSLWHWGDLDYGGILILHSLRASVWPEVRAWRMEPEWVDEFRQYILPVRPDYRAKLQRLLSSEQYRDQHPLVQKLLEVDGVLEQEAFIT